MKSRELLRLLADGEIHSGESLATLLGVSRTAVWKQVRRVEAEGYKIDTIRGKGYRLAAPLDLLDADSILGELPDRLRPEVSLKVYDELDSTNAEIIRQRAKGRDSRTLICIADHQTAGRGRRGRQWQSPRGENLYMSLGLSFRGGFSQLDGLSLALGLAVAQALESLGVRRAGLKWPNDVFLDNCKLSGILVELQGELEEGLVQVIAGIGINVHMLSAPGLDQAWTSLAKAAPERSWQRNRIAGAIVTSVLSAADVFSETGFRSFVEPWQARDIFMGQPLVTADGNLSGIGCGVDEQGNYLIRVDNELKKVRAGEISLRITS